MQYFSEQNNHGNSVSCVMYVQLGYRSHIKEHFMVYFPHEPHRGGGGINGSKIDGVCLSKSPNMNKCEKMACTGLYV